MLLRNTGVGTFANASTDVELNSVTDIATTGVSWADVTGDGELDLFVGGALSGQASQLLVQSITANGSYEYDHSFAIDTSALPTSPSTLDEIRAVAWHDMNADGALDLVLAGYTAGENGSRILWNDGSGDLSSTSQFIGLGSVNGVPAKGQSVFDLDLDGNADALFAPSSFANRPYVFRNQGDGTTPTFSDLSESIDMSTGSSSDIRAVTTVDIAGASNTPDGDEDIYLGRPESTDAYFYQNAIGGIDAPANKWLKIRLSNDGRPGNRFGIGSAVTVSTTLPSSDTLEQTQIVDGGSGAGSQRARELVFGLADADDDVYVSVTWPDGYVQSDTVSAASLDSMHTITNDHPVALEGSSPYAYAITGAGAAVDWVFEWETDYLSDPSLDKVVVSDGKTACSGYSGVVLTPGTTDVYTKVFALPGGGYLHRLVWEDRGCLLGCKYKYTVSSAVSSNPSDRQSSSEKIFKISVCIN